MFYLASTAAKNFILSNVKGVAQQGINLVDLREIPTPHTPLSDQQRLVSRIRFAFSWIDRLAFEAISARKLIDHLDETVLSKAFGGKLVPQDPKDEPAYAVLERIKAEPMVALQKKR
jgi:type I restriction enzyme S subunit